MSQFAIKEFGSGFLSRIVYEISRCEDVASYAVSFGFLSIPSRWSSTGPTAIVPCLECLVCIVVFLFKCSDNLVVAGVGLLGLHWLSHMPIWRGNTFELSLV